MIKFLKVFLSGILTISFTVSGTKIFENIITKAATNDSPFHSDITFSDKGTLTNWQEGMWEYGYDQDMYTDEIEINWTNNAKSWSQFQQYYRAITLYATGYAKGKKATKKSFTYFNITIKDIDEQDNWHDIQTLKSVAKYNLAYTTYTIGLGSYEKAAVYYDVIHYDNLIK